MGRVGTIVKNGMILQTYERFFILDHIRKLTRDPKMGQPHMAAVIASCWRWPKATSRILREFMWVSIPEVGCYEGKFPIIIFNP